MPNACYDPATGNMLGTEKPLLTIYTALNALTTTQQTNVWNAFTAGNPPKWSEDGVAPENTQDGKRTHGAHADAVAAASIGAIDLSGISAADRQKARLKMVAIYLYDNPLWLQNPPFDASINVVPFA